MEKTVHLAVAHGVHDDVLLCCPFIQRGALDEILDLVGTIPEGFPTYLF